MPKIAKVGKFRKAAAAATAAATATVSTVTKPKESKPEGADVSLLASKTSSTNPPQTENEPLSRGQRKRFAKREQYMKRENMILSSLQLRREDEQKKRIDGLDAVKKALLETAKEEAPEEEQIEQPNLLKSNKSRQKLVAKEVSQMNLVLQHPSFQADPFATIRQHLQNTLAKDSAEQKKQAVVHLRERKEKEERKKVAKKEQGVKKKRKKFKATRSKTR
jgi:hypothetical protein